MTGIRWPRAFYRGPKLTKLLLERGANPNHIDSAKRPLWWGVLSSSDDAGIETLRVLLDHGADVKLRDAEGGPVAWAAYYKNLPRGVAVD